MRKAMIGFVGAATGVALIAMVACGDDTTTEAPKDSGPDGLCVCRDATTADGTIADSDGGDDSATPGDGGADSAVASRCNPTSAFGAPVLVTSLAAAGSSDESAHLTADELTVYFSSLRDGGQGGYDIYSATRADASADFGAAAPVGNVNTSGQDRHPAISGDNRFLYIAASAAGFDITESSRATSAQPFGAPARVSGLDASLLPWDPYPLPDNTVLYFAETATGAIYRATGDGGSFVSPQPVSVDVRYAEAPVVTPDELTLFFADMRDGGMGFDDIYVATRATKNDPFGAPVPLTVASTPDRDFPSWISADGCVLYSTSFDPDGGSYHVYASKRGN